MERSACLPTRAAGSGDSAIPFADLDKDSTSSCSVGDDEQINVA